MWKSDFFPVNIKKTGKIEFNDLFAYLVEFEILKYLPSSVCPHPMYASKCLLSSILFILQSSILQQSTKWVCSVRYIPMISQGKFVPMLSNHNVVHWRVCVNILCAFLFAAFYILYHFYVLIVFVSIDNNLF